MINIIKKSEQYNEAVFHNRLIGNKPVYSGQANVKPFSNVFYWNHAVTTEACEFPLHPHQGFEIMTFVLKGQQEHYDTATNVWTPLKAGDFQIIQSNRGIQHRERLDKDLRGFQIWFDPNFHTTTILDASYHDYPAANFQPKLENGIKTITYVGNGSSAKVLTPGLSIKKLIFERQVKFDLSLDSNKSYIFYVLEGIGTINNADVNQDDSIRITGENLLNIDFCGELFYTESPAIVNYSTIWE